MNLDRAGPVLCFGEVLVRLSPPAGTRLAVASNLSVHVGGAEANAAAVLAQLARPVELVTRLPDSPLGDLCLGELRRIGVGAGHIKRGRGRIGLYFLEPGAGARPGRVTYDRAGSLFAEAADSFDWPALARDAAWFHLSGINLAVGERAAAEAVTAAAAMQAEGVPVSFDVNHRASLWEGRIAGAVERVRELIGMADLLFAGPADLARVLETEVAATAEQRRSAAEAAFDRWPRLSLIASTLREAVGAAQTSLSARIDVRDSAHESEPAQLAAVVDRIGSGDAFAGAVIGAVLRRAPLDRAARFGLAAAVLKHSMAGDRWIGSRDDLESFDPAARADVQR